MVKGSVSDVPPFLPLELVGTVFGGLVYTHVLSTASHGVSAGAGAGAAFAAVARGLFCCAGGTRHFFLRQDLKAAGLPVASGGVWCAFSVPFPSRARNAITLRGGRKDWGARDQNRRERRGAFAVFFSFM